MTAQVKHCRRSQSIKSLHTVSFLMVSIHRHFLPIPLHLPHRPSSPMSDVSILFGHAITRPEKQMLKVWSWELVIFRSSFLGITSLCVIRHYKLLWKLLSKKFRWQWLLGTIGHVLGGGQASVAMKVSRASSAFWGHQSCQQITDIDCEEQVIV